MHRRIGYTERTLIHRWIQEEFGIREIARRLGRAPSTVSREIRRNSGGRGYRPKQAQSKAEERARRPGSRRLTEGIKRDIAEKLFAGWTPEAICGRAAIEGRPHVCKETVYQHIYEDARHGGNLWTCLPRSKRKRRRRCPRSATAGRGIIPGRIDIDRRPEDVLTRETAGDWEGDLVNGSVGSGHFVTLVERKTRYTLVGLVASKESRPVMRKMREMLSAVPPRLLRSLTLDNGKEFAAHQALTEATGMPVYFAKPYHSWERGTNENRNGIIRRMFPKGSSFANVGKKQFALADKLLNDRPMKLLGWRTPREMFVAALR